MQNFKIIDGALFQVPQQFCSYEFEKVTTQNVCLIGYSKAHGELLVCYTNEKEYIYKDVPASEWERWQQQKKAGQGFGSYQAHFIKGTYRYEQVMVSITETDNGTLLDAYNDMCHNHTTNLGLWATDRPDLISDPENILFQIK